MKKMQRESSIVKIARYTLADEVRQKSFVVMFTICVMLVFLMRGCYQGNYMVNGQAIDPATIVGVVTKASFHVIAVAVMLIAALLSMRLFRRDRADGIQSSILSKPITRREYIMGRLLGLWVLSALFMFILHVVIFLIASITLGVVAPGILIASLLCSFNLLFVVIAVLLLSLLMPDIVAFICIIGIGVVGLVSDGIHALSSGAAAQMMMQQGIPPQARPSLGKIIYFLWPKVTGTERFASTFIGWEGLSGFWFFYPFVNILLYSFILGLILILRFHREEIV